MEWFLRLPQQRVRLKNDIVDWVRELASGATVVDGLTANSESAVLPWVDQVLSQTSR